tara:strand:+ start:857 stop:1876 length:1020 start_codon:yes stop_codon:yes gene_type:complete
VKILITGITGFVGSHLAEYILGLGERHEISGLCRWRSPRDNLKNIINEVELLDGDLTDLSSLIRVMEKVKPDIIFHLAAQSYVQTSFTSPIDTLQKNVIGTVNLLEAVRYGSRKWNFFDPIIQIASSSEVYGEVSNEDQPTKETAPLKPASQYAVGKVGEDMLAYQYNLSYGLKTLRTRMFSHTGARRGDVFVLSAFAKQIAAMELGLMKKEMRVGNLNSKRTFIDVRDAVRAYWILVNQVTAYGDVFNIGGDKQVRIKDCLDSLIVMSNLNREEIKVIVDKSLIRPSDVTSQIPDSSKFRNETGWEPRIHLGDTLLSILKYWRTELKLNPWKSKSVDR